MSSGLILGPAALDGSPHHSRASRWLGAASNSAHSMSLSAAARREFTAPAPSPLERIQNLIPSPTRAIVTNSAIRVDKLIRSPHRSPSPDVIDLIGRKIQLQRIPRRTSRVGDLASLTVVTSGWATLAARLATCVASGSVPT